LANKLKEIFFVEDAGLFIRALNGFPGPYSSFVYKTIGIRGILKLLNDVSDRTAFFKSVIGLWCNDHIEIFEGVVEGHITKEPRGAGGFGFDPIFIPKGCKKTFAEMSVDEKNLFSHRAKASEQMIGFLKRTICVS